MAWPSGRRRSQWPRGTDTLRAELQRKVESEQRVKEQAVSLQREVDAPQAQTNHIEKNKPWVLLGLLRPKTRHSR